MRFNIQTHRSKRLHHDLRLEHAGVLASWAVPKLVPTIQGVRRLAIQTPDHPLSYLDFNGKIEEGRYGAGTVELTDSGEYTLEEWSPKKITFELHGRHYKGRYVLIQALDDWFIFLRRTKEN